MHSDQVRALRAKVIGFQVASIRMNRRIKKLKREKRAQLQLRKKTLGRHAREHLIAYGLVRGIEYALIEQPGKHNVPPAERILNIIKEHDPWNQRWRNCTWVQLEKLFRGELKLADLDPKPKQVTQAAPALS